MVYSITAFCILHVARLEFPRETGLILRCAGKAGNPSVVSDSVRPQRQQPTRLPRPWDSPGKNTGVGCHFLPQCSERPHGSSNVWKEVKMGDVTLQVLKMEEGLLSSLPGSSVHRIFQARVLEWGAIAFSDTAF